MNGLESSLDMLKLLKYDFKSFFLRHILLIIVLMISGGLVRLSSYLAFDANITGNVVVYLEVANGIMKTMFYITVFIIPLMTFIMVISRYRRKVLGDEAYLTHTLPVTKNAILISTLLNAIIYLLMGVLGILLGLFIMMGVSEFIVQIKLYRLGEFSFYLLAGLMVVILVVVFISQFLLAFTLGYSHETNKNRNTIFYGIGIYLFNQFAGMVLLVIGFLSLYIISNNINEKLILTIGILYYIVIFIVTYSILNYTLKNRLNLE